MANPNPNTENLKPFTKTHRPKNPGRKPSKLKKYIKENNLGTKDIQLLSSNLTNMSIEELKALVQDKTKPIILVGAASAMLKDFTKGQFSCIQWLTDRAYGKPTEKIDQTNRDGFPDVTEMSHEERRALLAELIKNRSEDG